MSSEKPTTTPSLHFRGRSIPDEFLKLPSPGGATVTSPPKRYIKTPYATPIKGVWASPGSKSFTDDDDGTTSVQSYHSTTSATTTTTTTKLLHPNSYATMGQWNVVSFLDLRGETSKNTSIGSLLLPDNTYVGHLIDQMRKCKTIIVICSLTTFVDIQKQCFNDPHIDLRCVSMDTEMPFWLIAKCYRDNWPYLWDDNTITLWWNSGICLEHEILWRPVAEKHSIVAFYGNSCSSSKDDDKPKLIAVTWQNSIWSDDMQQLKGEDMALLRHVLSPSSATGSPTHHSDKLAYEVTTKQNVWDFAQDSDYFDYITHKTTLSKVSSLSEPGEMISEGK